MEWDLSLLFKTQDEIETLLPKLEEQVKSLTTYKGKILDFSTKDLSDFIDEYELLQYSSAKLSQYPYVLPRLIGLLDNGQHRLHV